MTGAITLSTLETNSYNDVFSILDTRSNIRDPRDPSGGRTFIYDADPFHKSVEFDDFPYIVFELPTLDYGTMSTDGKRKNITFTHRIVLRSKRDGTGHRGSTITGRQDILQMGDDLNKTCNSLTQRQTLRDWAISDVDLVKVSTDTFVIEDTYVYEAVYELTYKVNWLQVSS